MSHLSGTSTLIAATHFFDISSIQKYTHVSTIRLALFSY